MEFLEVLGHKYVNKSFKWCPKVNGIEGVLD
jgi:hypothetical protein